MPFNVRCVKMIIRSKKLSIERVETKKLPYGLIFGVEYIMQIRRNFALSQCLPFCTTLNYNKYV